MSLKADRNFIKKNIKTKYYNYLLFWTNYTNWVGVILRDQGDFSVFHGVLISSEWWFAFSGVGFGWLRRGELCFHFCLLYLFLVCRFISHSVGVFVKEKIR